MKLSARIRSHLSPAGRAPDLPVPWGRRLRPPAPRMAMATGAGILLLLVLSGTSPAAPAAPSLQAVDTPNDAGSSINLGWTPVEGAAEYFILRAQSAAGPFAVVDSADAGTTSYTDIRQIQDDHDYYYRLDARLPAGTISSSVQGPVQSKAQWFNSSRINTLVAVILLSLLVMYFIEVARRGGNIFIRKIAGLEAVDEAVGRATEMGRKILYIPGTGDMDSVQTLASIAILGRAARTTAQYDTPLEVPVSRSMVMVACRETVKEAYLSAGRPDSYNEAAIYYLTDDQFGYAAALEGLMTREKPATIFLQGQFYAESLILAETGNSVGAIQIAGTAETSQLPFFVACCDYTLLGEELFVAGAYLSHEPRQLGSLKGQDMGKAIILLILLIGIVIQTAGWFDVSTLFVVQ